MGLKKIVRTYLEDLDIIGRIVDLKEKDTRT
jgi:hypothetical protein